jgi:hypothetical protein
VSVMQHTVRDMQGSIINVEQDVGHHDNNVTGQEDSVAARHEDEIDTVAAGGDRGPEEEREVPQKKRRRGKGRTCSVV